MHYATWFHDRQVLTDMLLQVRYSCGEGGQEAILSIKVRFLVAALSIALVCGLPAGLFCLLLLLHHCWSYAANHDMARNHKHDCSSSACNYYYLL